ncbi:MAG: carbohydrate ABC transporter permease [Defluviitaleaceae bacterium]|nr:carbohydrate ABC transporter permease [Defluviitaleaceae bacterium]
MAVNRTKGERVFGIFNILIMLILIFVTLYPLWYVLIASFSNPTAVARGLVIFWPSGFESASYKAVASTPYLWSSYGNTIFYSVAGTAVSMVLTILGAYPLSKKRLKGRKFFMFVILFTMWFGAGMMPTYLNFRNLGLLDNRIGVILAFAVNTFWVILMRTFFESVPDSMEESAKMDGANDFTILVRIYMPLAVSAIATLTLFYFVGRWNSYFWSMIMLQDQSKVPLQVLLRRLIVQVSYTVNESVDRSLTTMTDQTVVYATIVVSVLPMLVLYPFIQRFFVKGIMVGAIKG